MHKIQLNFLFQACLVMLLVVLIQEVAAPLPNYMPDLRMPTSRHALIRIYFNMNYTYKEILRCLSVFHGITISLITLKRTLYKLGLKRRTPLTQDIIVTAASEIEKQLKESGQNLGYKTMWRRLQDKGIVIARDTVRHILYFMDKEGVQERARRRLQRRRYVNPGPNFVWHVDGYDKLKPYGFAIHGAIDGFSRKIMWLEVGITNNNPKVTVKYFLDTILDMKTSPCVVRCDHGTENIHIKQVQCYLRRNGNDEFAGQHSFLQGRSVHNQRIEAWWAILRRQCVNYWINLFKDMIDIGVLDTDNPLHIHILRFCFMDLIEQDIQRTATEWNRHLIETKKTNDELPRGKPDIMYFDPEQYGTQSYGIEVPEEDVHQLLFELDEQDAIPNTYPPEFVQLINGIIPNWKEPIDSDAALKLYGEIHDLIAKIPVP